MHMKDHVHKAVVRYHFITEQPVLEDSPSKTLYKILATKDESSLVALATKIERRYSDKQIPRDDAMMIARQIQANTALLPRSLPSRLRSHAFVVIHNALLTKCRIDPGGENKTANRCFFCEREPETIRHIHTCSVVKRAANLVLRRQADKSNFVCLLSAEEDDFLFRGSSVSAKEQLTLLCFSLAIWRCRGILMADPSNSGEKSVHMLPHIFKELYGSVATKRVRKSRNREAQKCEFLRLLGTLPQHNAARVYTDGSVLNGNPGEAGAGFTYRTGPGSGRVFYSKCLGVTTNNVAELIAFELACRHVADTINADPTLRADPPSVFIFVDNMYTINAVEGSIKVRTNKSQVALSCAALSALAAMTPVFLHWVPAHVGILENDIADALAKRGAKGVTSSQPLLPQRKQQPKVDSIPLDLGELEAADDYSSSDEDDDVQAEHKPLQLCADRKSSNYRRSSRTRLSTRGCLFPSLSFSDVPPVRKRSREVKRQATERQPTRISNEEMRKQLSPDGCASFTIKRPRVDGLALKELYESPGMHLQRLCQLDLSESERMQYLEQKLADVTTYVPMAQFMAPELLALLEEALPCKRSNKRSSEPLQAPPPKRYHPTTPKRELSPACRPDYDLKKRRLNTDGDASE
jgi:ribonuclease HI